MITLNSISNSKNLVYYYNINIERCKKMSVNFLKLHWKITVKQTGEVIECSDKDLYANAPSNNDFKPFEVVIGKEKLFKKLEEAIQKNINSKDYFKVELAAEEAYGKKNPKMLETIPLREFTKQKINPYPGAVLDFGGISGKVLFIGSGRVTVDFNHPLSSKNLEYEVKIVDEIKEALDQVNVLVAPYKNAIKDLKVNLENGKLTLESKTDIKQSFAEVEKEIKELVKDVKEIEYKKTEVKKPVKSAKKVTTKKTPVKAKVVKETDKTNEANNTKEVENNKDK